MHIPCKTCPWRKTTRTEDIPGGGMDHVRSQGARGQLGGFIMACHLTTDEKPAACAGWVEKVAKPLAWSSGEQAIPMRLLLGTGGINLTEFSNGGAELHEDMDAMLAAHPPRRRRRGRKR